MALMVVLSYVSKSDAAKVAYVYSPGESDAALQYKSFLDSCGFTTTLVGMSQVSSTDLSIYDVIIIGYATGGTSIWGDSATVAHIKNSNKPTLGLGEGGYAFFGKLSLHIGYANGAHGSGMSVRLNPTADPFLHSPNAIPVPADSVLDLYDFSIPVVEIPLEFPPASVTRVAADSANTGYQALVEENNRYFLWGYSSVPQDMSQTAKVLFDNIVSSMSTTTAVASPLSVGPSSAGYQLLQNYPNPFNPSTVISFQLPVTSNVKLRVLDLLGREIAALVDGRMESGAYKATWDARGYPSGVYYYRLETNTSVGTKKLILLK